VTSNPYAAWAASGPRMLVGALKKITHV
jgi:hypothetical protein